MNWKEGHKRRSGHLQYSGGNPINKFLSIAEETSLDRDITLAQKFLSTPPLWKLIVSILSHLHLRLRPRLLMGTCQIWCLSFFIVFVGTLTRFMRFSQSIVCSPWSAIDQKERLRQATSILIISQAGKLQRSLWIPYNFLIISYNYDYFPNRMFGYLIINQYPISNHRGLFV